MTIFHFNMLLVITPNCTDLAGVLPVHGVDGGPRVHVHEVVMVVARHDSTAPVMELHG